MRRHGAFRVVTDTYVTEEGGTGVVHQAPYFGEVSDSDMDVFNIHISEAAICFGSFTQRYWKLPAKISIYIHLLCSARWKM